MKSLAALFTIVLMVAPAVPVSAESLDIGSRLELFVDDYLIDELAGDAQLKLHRPEPREVVLVTDRPWEGNTSAYYTIFQDGDVLRMYYRGSHFDEKAKKVAHREVTCYAESTDGIWWTRPNLGLFEFDGSKQNNIVWDGVGTHCFTVFRDANPEASLDARYKALSRGRPRAKKGLYAFKSPDAVHWTMIQDDPVITEGAFDSQNLAFWDPHAKVYREYHRSFVDGVRAVMTGTSKNFVNWTKPVLLVYGDAPNEHLYTNAVQPYFRAPHILLGFPTRYLPGQGERVEPTLMASHDGLRFKRWLDPLIPEDAPEEREGNRSNYMTWGLIQLPGDSQKLSVYATEAYYTGPDCRVRRFTFRVDGFVSLTGRREGTLLTKPVTFRGSRLQLNFLTREGGSVRVGLHSAEGRPIRGFSLDECRPLSGDEPAQAVTWEGGDLSQLADRPVRLLFEVRAADVFSFQFR